MDTRSAAMQNPIQTCLRTPGQWHATALARDAWMNIKVDIAAKEQIMEQTWSINYKKLPFEPWCMVINNQKIIKQHQQAIRVAMNGLSAQQYWKKKCHQ